MRQEVTEAMCARLNCSPRWWALSLIAGVTMLMAACGWHLRGQVNLPFERIHVESDGFSLFAAELRRVIQSGSAVQLTKTPQEAQVILRVLGEVQEKRILSLSQAGSVSEFELYYQVNYRVMDNQMQDLVAPNQISLRRDLTFDDTQTLGKESEEQLLYRDMQTDAVQLMLRRLSVVLVNQ
jgi:LPS-assembly lipoprotein